MLGFPHYVSPPLLYPLMPKSPGACSCLCSRCCKCVLMILNPVYSSHIFSFLDKHGFICTLFPLETRAYTHAYSGAHAYEHSHMYTHICKIEPFKLNVFVCSDRTSSSKSQKLCGTIFIRMNLGVIGLRYTASPREGITWIETQLLHALWELINSILTQFNSGSRAIPTWLRGNMQTRHNTADYNPVLENVLLGK